VVPWCTTTKVPFLSLAMPMHLGSRYKKIFLAYVHPVINPKPDLIREVVALISK